MSSPDAKDQRIAALESDIARAKQAGVQCLNCFWLSEKVAKAEAVRDALAADNTRLREALNDIFRTSEDYMEGAGEPEFGNYVNLGSMALRALARDGAGGGA